MPTTEERHAQGRPLLGHPRGPGRADRGRRAARRSLEFQRAGDAGWKMIRPEKYPADPFAVGSLVPELAELKRAGGDDADEARPGGLRPRQARSATATIVWSDAGGPEDAQDADDRVRRGDPRHRRRRGARGGHAEGPLRARRPCWPSLKKSADDFESREVFGGPPPTSTRLEILRGRGRLVVRPQGRGLVAGRADRPTSPTRAEVDRLVGVSSDGPAGARISSTATRTCAAHRPEPAALPRHADRREGRRRPRSTSARRARTATPSTPAGTGQVLTRRAATSWTSSPRRRRRSAAATLLGFDRGDVDGGRGGVRERTRYVLTQKDGGWTRRRASPVLAAGGGRRPDGAARPEEPGTSSTRPRSKALAARRRRR